MKTLRCILGVVAVGYACAFLPGTASALEPVRREGWTLGLGLGLGHGSISPPSGDDFYAKDGAVAQISVARAVSSRLRLGVTWHDWLTERGDEELRIRRTMQSWVLAGTWVPGDLENAWSGLYLRGGVGIAQGRYSTAGADEHGEDIDLLATDQTGVALLGTIGYEFAVAKHAAAGVSFTANVADYGDDLFDHGWFAPVSVTLNWTF